MSRTYHIVSPTAEPSPQQVVAIHGRRHALELLLCEFDDPARRLELRALAYRLCTGLDVGALDDHQLFEELALLLCQRQLKLLCSEAGGVSASFLDDAQDPADPLEPEETADGVGRVISARWDRRRCYHGDHVQLLVRCSDDTPDGTRVTIRVFESDIGDPDDVVQGGLFARVQNARCKVRYTMDWIDRYEPERESYEFYFSAALQGKAKKAKSGMLYVDLPHHMVF